MAVKKDSTVREYFLVTIGTIGVGAVAAVVIVPFSSRFTFALCSELASIVSPTSATSFGSGGSIGRGGPMPRTISSV